MATKFTKQIQPSDIWANTSNQELELGTYAETPDGRGFRYVKAGGTSLVVGKLQQSPAQVANHLGCAVAAASAIGATTVTVTLGATAATLNQYAGGFLVVTATPGEGYTYKIKSNPAADASASCVITLEDPIKVALTTSSTVDLVLNQYNGVIVNPTTATGRPVGVGVNIVTNAYFGWIQTKGEVACLNDSSTTIGLGVAPSAATAGAVKTAATTLETVGFTVNTGTTTKYNCIFLTID